METGSTTLGDRVHGRLGLRERKKLKAMRRIQEVALDLFDEHGYGAVTIERIAAAAEVSPSSIYRYFGTKEQIILYDESDPAMLRAFDEELAHHGPAEAIRRSLALIGEQLLSGDEAFIRRRMHYMMSEPAVRAGIARQMEEADAVIREILARRTDRAVGDLDVRVVTASVVAGFVAAVEYWHDTDYREPLDAVLDRALDFVSGGLKLE